MDGCDCEETLRLIAEGKLNTEPLITHTYSLERIEEAYELFEGKRDGVIKVAVECEKTIQPEVRIVATSGPSGFIKPIP